MKGQSDEAETKKTNDMSATTLDRPAIISEQECVFFPYESGGTPSEMLEKTRKLITPPDGMRVEPVSEIRRREDNGESTFVPGFFVDYYFIPVGGVQYPKEPISQDLMNW